MAAKTEGLLQLKLKVLARLPEAGRRLVRDANEKNADEFMDRYLAVLPEDSGDLARTVEKQPVGSFGFQVSVGGPSAPYPAHVEWGHIDKRSGVHVAAKPAWFPVLRVLKKRFKSRQTRAMNAAIKTVTTDGGSDG